MRGVIDSLPDDRADLARETLAWCDRFWDDDRALPWAPRGSGFGRVHLVQQSGWYAYGLMLRGAAGDRERAARCLEALFALQYDEPGAPWHGTFARFGETERPPRDAIMWVHFDPNWRQFIGTTCVLLLLDFEAQLPPALVRRIDRALRLAVAGEPEGRIAASYANIALMHAFLLVEAGTRFGESSWVAKGEAFANEIADGFEQFGAFQEYNSPTYYGIDLHALALWSERSSSQSLRTRGRSIEAALWRDIARWYHAGLRNLCGPYSRSYGFDMTRYVAQLGLDLWAAAEREAAPLPPLDTDAEHGHDLFLGPLTAALGRRVPDDARSALTHFPGEHSVVQQVAANPERIATGWLGERLMIGAERHASDRYSAWEQYTPATVHWQLPDGGVGTIAARTNGAPAFEASPRALTLGGSPGTATSEVRISIFIPSQEATRFDPKRWTLPGLVVDVDGAWGEPRTERAGGAPKIAIDAKAGGRLAFS